MLIRKTLWSQYTAVLLHSLCGKSPFGPLIVRHSTCNGIGLPVSVIEWMCRDIWGSHTLMDAWVSAHSFYQLISGSSSNGIIAIILHYKYQTIYFCWDSDWQLLLPAVIFFYVRALEIAGESVSFFQHLIQLGHMKLRIKAFQKKFRMKKIKPSLFF